MQKFGSELINKNKIPTESYDVFRNNIHSIIHKTSEAYSVDEAKSIIPTKKLTSMDIFNLPKDCKKTAFAMLELEEGTVMNIAHHTKESIETTTGNLLHLQNLGYIGVKFLKGEKFYFCSVS